MLFRSATGTSPFYVTSGFHPNWETTFNSQGSNESSTDFIRRMEKSWEDAKAKLDRTKRLMKDQYNTHRRTAIVYKPGDIVWLNASNILSQRPSKKLDHKYLGLYKVVKKIGALAYQLSSQGQSTRHATFNEQYLKPFKRGIYPSHIAEPAPPAELIDGEEEWEVEEIKDSRYLHGQLQYLVHRKGFDVSEDTWEPAKHLTHAPELVTNFHSRYPTKPKPRKRQFKSRRCDSLRGG